MDKTNIKSINYLLIAIITITPLIIYPLYIDYFYLPKLVFLYCNVMISAVIWFLHKNNNKLFYNNSVKIIIMYFITIFISTIFSSNIYRSLYGSPEREEGFFTIIIYIYLFILTLNKYRYSKAPLKFMFISISIVALYGILQYFGLDPIPRDIYRINWTGRAFSTMGNPNFLGSYLTLVFPICIYAYIYKNKISYLIISGIVYTCLLCTLTRSAWLGSLISFIMLLVYVFKHKYNRQSILKLLLLFFVITLCINYYSNGQILGRFFTISRDIGAVINKAPGYDTSGANRIFIWERVIELIKNKPLIGYGLENLGDIFTERYFDEILSSFGQVIIFDKAHNEYLHIAVSTGIPSLVLYLTFVFSILIKAFKNLKHDHLIIPMLCSVIGYLVQAFFNISVVSVAYIYWIFLGILLNFSLKVDEKMLNYDSFI